MTTGVYTYDSYDGVLTQGEPAWDLNGDGFFTHNEAQNWYRNGNGVPVTVDASGINLMYIDPNIFLKGKTQTVSLLGHGDLVQGTVYGQLQLTYQDNGFVLITPNTYDFSNEGHPWFGGSFWRNVATVLGGINDGIGAPNAQQFNIIFQGQTYVGFPNKK